MWLASCSLSWVIRACLDGFGNSALAGKAKAVVALQRFARTLFVRVLRLRYAPLRMTAFGGWDGQGHDHEHVHQAPRAFVKILLSIFILQF